MIPGAVPDGTAARGAAKNAGTRFPQGPPPMGSASGGSERLALRKEFE